MRVVRETVKSRILRGAFHERLRPLGPEQRDLLLHAAALGRHFHVDVLAVLVGQTPAQTRRALRRACAMQLLEGVDGSPGRFQFRHALTRDAMYSELVASQLQPLHREIALALEGAGAASAGASIDELAYHWWAAGDPERGSRYNEEAGDRAAAVYAEDDALMYYRRALDLLALSPARRRIEAKIDALGARAGDE